jgi:hypothetical protein
MINVGLVSCVYTRVVELMDDGGRSTHFSIRMPLARLR